MLPKVIHRGCPKVMPQRKPCLNPAGPSDAAALRTRFNKTSLIKMAHRNVIIKTFLTFVVHILHGSLAGQGQVCFAGKFTLMTTVVWGDLFAFVHQPLSESLHPQGRKHFNSPGSQSTLLMVIINTTSRGVLLLTGMLV